MKKSLLFSFLSFLFCGTLIAQITRGASPGEVYISNFWYYYPNGLNYSAIFYSSDHGEHLYLQYASPDYALPDEMKVGNILGDAEQGALYNLVDHELWVSFDYGETWVFRENFPDYTQYFTGTIPGLIYKGTFEGFFKSTDFALTFELLPITVTCPFTEVGFSESEFYGIYGEPGLYFNFVHTTDYGQTFTQIPIDSTIAYWQIGGKYPEISRGTEPGEIYLISWWPNAHYKIFHSVDTGYTWTQQYESEYVSLYDWGVQYTAGRQPGSFYVKRATSDPYDWHTQVYIDYSSDYGKTFTTYFHDLDSLYTSIILNEGENISLSVSPNPFSVKTIFKYELPCNIKKASLNIYSTNGVLIKQFTLFGKGELKWDGKDQKGDLITKGIYIYNIQIENTFLSSNKLIFNP
nr:T9SS type A sorting domain-containing protein [Bacteroidota bacterium]